MYQTVGIIVDNKHIFVPTRHNDIIEEDVDKIALIKSIKSNHKKFDEKYLRLDNVLIRSGETLLISDVEYDELNLYSKETIATLLDLGLISHTYQPEFDDTKDWLLSHLIQYEKDLPEDMLVYILKDNPEYDIEGWLTLAKNLNIAKWLRKNGASLEKVRGYGCAKDWWEIKGLKNLIEFFY